MKIRIKLDKKQIKLDYRVFCKFYILTINGNIPKHMSVIKYTNTKKLIINYWANKRVNKKEFSISNIKSDKHFRQARKFIKSLLLNGKELNIF